MKKWIKKSGFLILMALLFSGCATTQPSTDRDHNALYVGVTPNYPPIIFKQGEQITGVEADLALRLGEGLGKPVRFVEVRWDQQISALIDGKTDIIMSGMTITEARKARIRFADPYIKSGLVTMMRAEDGDKFNSLESIQQSYTTVGVVAGTTGEAFVRKNFLNALGVIAFPKAADAVYLLKNMKIDIMVYDAPSIVWLVSENEGILKGFWQPLNVEYLGWGIRSDDQQLLTQVNTTLKKWKTDGTLREVFGKWLPYWKNFD
jgi:ABC-type amino acid transport substrate-binding protein